MSRELLERQVALFKEAEQVAEMGWWTWDTCTNELFWSDNMYRLMGYAPQTVEPSMEGFFGQVHPQDIERVMRMVARAAETQRSPPMEYRIVGADGRTRHVRGHGSAVVGPDGEVLYQVGTLQDRSETVQREQVAERNRVLLAKTQLAAAAGAFEFWPETGLLHGSAAFYRHLKLPADQPIPVSELQALVFAEDRRLMPLLAGLESELGVPLRCSVRLQIQNQVLHTSFVSSLEELAGGERYVAGAMLDIGEQILLEKKLRAAQKLETLGRLSAGISHDFNNLLTVILANAAILNEDHPGPELGAILEAATQGDQLTRKLLAVGRQVPEKVGPLDMDRSVSQSVRLLKGILGSGVKLRTTLSASAEAICEPNQLQQMLFNLIINAYDALDGDGEIWVSTQRSTLGASPAVSVTVSDNGPGMSAEIRERIFEPFFTTKSTEHGSGLGLGMVRDVMGGLGGSVEIQGGPGQGTQVILRFRRVQAQVAPAQSGKMPLVLLVEDDHQVRGLIRQIMEISGYRVVEAEDPSLARRALWKQVPDLVISDLNMPDGGGRALLSHVQENHPGLPVLLITGHDLDQGGLGVPVLRKPFTSGQLRAAARDALQSVDGDLDLPSSVKSLLPPPSP
ncbi:MAG: PAS domain S-box-containing protein [Cognaticolwellia sp.]|jgi:PAS domain S-box-containing protein